MKFIILIIASFLYVAPSFATCPKHFDSLELAEEKANEINNSSHSDEVRVIEIKPDNKNNPCSSEGVQYRLYFRGKLLDEGNVSGDIG